MTFEKLTLADLPRAMEIVETARAYLARQGLDQWQNGYPFESDLRADIEAGNLYGLRDEGCVPGEDSRLMSICAVVFGREAMYDQIFDGAWQTEFPYAAVHRVAVDNSRVRRGYASRMFAGAQALADSAGLHALRIDTHPGNLPMQEALARNGFVRCGVVYLPAAPNAEGTRERIGFEKNW